eukprot:COSAG01_NODE_34522_length_546_cov_0.939597_1_plen_68_part_01
MLRYMCAWVLGLGVFVLMMPMALLIWLLNVTMALACTAQLALYYCCTHSRASDHAPNGTDQPDNLMDT